MQFFLWIFVVIILHHQFADSVDVVVSPPTNRYVFKPGEKITLTFRYRKAPNSEFIWFKCGRLDESKTRSLDPNNIDDIIVLVQINQDRTVRLVEFMPMEYNRRVDVISIGDGLNFIIDPLRASDQGRYICVLLVYDNDEFRTKSIRSTYVTLKTLDAQAQTSSDSSRTIVLAVILTVIALVILAIIVGVYCYKKKQRKPKEAWPPPTTSNTPNKVKKRSKRNEIFLDTESELQSGDSPNKVEIVPTLEDAIAKSRIRKTIESNDVMV